MMSLDTVYMRSLLEHFAVCDLLGSVTDAVSFRDVIQPPSTCSLPAPFHEVQIIPFHNNGCKRTLMRGKRFGLANLIVIWWLLLR